MAQPYIYVRQGSETPLFTLYAAKADWHLSRSLPRLELLAAQVGTRILHYVCQAIGCETEKAVFWSDSAITLGWIRSDPSLWKTFICNRVTEI
jgi:hypothetical protein